MRLAALLVWERVEDGDVEGPSGPRTTPASSPPRPRAAAPRATGSRRPSRVPPSPPAGHRGGASPCDAPSRRLARGKALGRAINRCSVRGSGEGLPAPMQLAARRARAAPTCGGASSRSSRCSASLVLVVAARAGPRRGARAGSRDARPGLARRSASCSRRSRASPTCVMFRPVFCRRMSWRTSWEIAWAELGVGSIVPASGAGGLALGAWILQRGGHAGRADRAPLGRVLPDQELGELRRRRGASATLMAVGAVGPHRSLLLTALPAALSRRGDRRSCCCCRGSGPGGTPGADAAKLQRAGRAPRAARSSTAPPRRSRIAARARPAGARRRDRLLGVGQRRAVGDLPRVRRRAAAHDLLMGYLIGQLGGLLPLPGGVGGIDGGLIGTLDRLRRAGGGDRRGGAGLPRDPVLAAAARAARSPSRRCGARSSDPERPDLCEPLIEPLERPRAASS